MNKCYGVLLDTTSIQHFVFSSSKLKDNTGASFIVSHIFKKMIDDKLEELKNGCKIEVGFTGGGNSLIFFESEYCASKFVRNLTLMALTTAPGLNIASATGEFMLNGSGDVKNLIFGNHYFSHYEKDRDALFDKLNTNKRQYFPKITLESFGINEDCPRTGKSAEVWDEKENEYISSISKTKSDYADKSLKQLNEKYKDELDKKEFPAEFGELGGTEGEDSHIAIVHIDGNSVGKLFKECKTLGDTKELSEKMNNATENAFRKLLKHISENIIIINAIITENKKFIPIRPIIIGGDDITFVCDGRMGIYFAEKFMEFFSEQQINEYTKISACAGIAIIKEKYPFYRGYLLAEDLCGNAKRKRNENEDKGNWIDYHFVKGSFTGKIEDIRENHFIAKQGKLYMKPYPLSINGICFKDIVDAAKKFSEKNKDGRLIFPRNKLNELREVLTQSREACKEFKSNLEVRGHKLPEIKGGMYKDFFENNETPFADIIELIKNYPFELIRKDKINEKT